MIIVLSGHFLPTVATVTKNNGFKVLCLFFSLKSSTLEAKIFAESVLNKSKMFVKFEFVFLICFIVFSQKFYQVKSRCYQDET